mmetsp:Transcript_32280/g.53353  ORF Transcript_32280/g.53353 Transcript_32280/m.53353 type:complete len:274 (+) Transcript_32280:70-891(+)|eukprot:CAMPEP_0119332822 /NCGR_PEP_ID=MMETSP1333-20130426/83689_1 /TAXON_ID=418940 /ORGANISM="Scyphosphaera apsteinii, Strain RCC1455" /LENGTH=273 /DNA_ID=CAMNT_0007342725 /DNA_START=47 /DNA_END=868 /DNA_ORIENTATION=-
MDRFLVKKRPVEEAADGNSTEASARKVARPEDPLLPASPSPEIACTESLLKELKDESWRSVLRHEFMKSYINTLATKVAAERAKHTVYPPTNDVFSALNYTPLTELRVVIIGQDPYHGPRQAHGLSFSVPRGVAVPPSLKNIYQELTTDIDGFIAPAHGNLEAWARRGVLLLNASLTVRQGQANSHADFGWQHFTDAVIQAANKHADGIVFILWGNFAQKKGKMISRARHYVLEAAHPSPLSVTKFRGCRVFSKANAYLTKKGRGPVDWRLPA